ncbi:hypothetical protein TNCV_3181321 [Trichonephila clavipes]|nr:hypothetical protein TNCV_3181321 [Trichonephila clavipes]
MKEGLIASSYECPKCNEQMGLNERKSVVLDGFEWRCRKKGLLLQGQSLLILPFSKTENDLEMANLPTDMELELAESQRNSSRTSSPLPQLTPCEQLKYSKAQLAKMETFRRCKQACVDALMMMPDHHPDEPFYVRALTELQDIEEAMALVVIKSTPNTNYSGKRNEISNFEYPPQRKTAKKIVLETTDNDEINLSQNKFELPQGAHLNNLEDSGPVDNGNNPNGSNNSASQNAPQNQLPPPIMLFVEKNYKAQMAAITKAFPKIRSRITCEFLKLYTDSAEERRMAVQHLKMLNFQF